MALLTGLFLGSSTAVTRQDGQLARYLLYKEAVKCREGENGLNLDE